MFLEIIAVLEWSPLLFERTWILYPVRSGLKDHCMDLMIKKWCQSYSLPFKLCSQWKWFAVKCWPGITKYALYSVTSSDYRRNDHRRPKAGWRWDKLYSTSRQAMEPTINESAGNSWLINDLVVNMLERYLSNWRLAVRFKAKCNEWIPLWKHV